MDSDKMAKIYINGQPVTPMTMFTPTQTEEELNPLAAVANVLSQQTDEHDGA